MRKKIMEAIKKNDEICVIRFICNNKNIAEVVNWVENLYTSSSNQELNANIGDFVVEYYKNNGNNRLVKKIYSENINSVSHFQYNNSVGKYFLHSNKQAFLKADDERKIIIFELQYDETEKIDKNFENISDPINFQYFLLLMDYMENKNIRHSVFVSGKTEISLYKPLEDKTYYQIRTFLYFCEDLQNDRIFFLRVSQNKTIWTRLFSDAKKDRKFDRLFGRILPLIPINQEIYKMIQEEVADIEFSSSNVAYKELIECYKERICGNYLVSREELKQYCLYDNYIEELIFLSTLYYCLEDHTEYKRYELDILHETCVDYAQGILQLIENVCFHAISEKTVGSGNFSIRIRKSSEMQSFLSSIDQKNRLYFMEIYVTDFIYDSEQFCGIVNKLYSNISARYDELEDENEKQVLENVLIRRETDQCIKLSEIFGKDVDTDSAYVTYLNHSINVAYHYGLQILNNAISVGEGYMCVRSGEGNNNYYSDNNNGKYKDQRLNWKNGTAYIIYLPLDLTEVIDYHDSIAIANDFEENDLRYKVKNFPDELIMKLSEISCCITPREKEQNVFMLMEEMNEEFSEKDEIYYIDCKIIKKKYSYEILAKFIFSCLIKKKINNIAVINVKNRQEVVKLFRQFALFYNRQGQNCYMKDKSVFIVDSRAQIDLLLKGTISDIKKDMYRSQIYGGIDEISMRIIEHLGRRGH